MKKILALLMVSSWLFAAEDLKGGSYTDFYTTFGFFYDTTEELIPAMTIGKKSVSKNGNGVDYGATFGYLERKEKKDDYFVMFPRMEYIHYGPQDFKTFNGYFGIGACTTMYRLKQYSFEGLAGNVTLGFEFYREKDMNGFIQGKAYYPLLSVKANEPKGLTVFFFDVGLGF